MKEQFVTYEIALKLKELGFDEQCICRYNAYEVLKHTISGTNPDMDDYVSSNKYDNRLLAPLYQQVIDWFREKHNIITTWNLHDGDNPNSWRITISRFDCYDLLYNQNVGREPYYKRYEEARDQAILKSIELCQKEK